MITSILIARGMDRDESASDLSQNVEGSNIKGPLVFAFSVHKMTDICIARPFTGNKFSGPEEGHTQNNAMLEGQLEVTKENIQESQDVEATGKKMKDVEDLNLKVTPLTVEDLREILD